MCRRTSNCNFAFFLKLVYPSEYNLRKKRKTSHKSKCITHKKQLWRVPLKIPCKKYIKDFQSPQNRFIVRWQPSSPTGKFLGFYQENANIVTKIPNHPPGLLTNICVSKPIIWAWKLFSLWSHIWIVLTINWNNWNFFVKNTSTPIHHIHHIVFFFFLQNTSCIRKPQVISGGGGGAHPQHPPPRSAPEQSTHH